MKLRDPNHDILPFRRPKLRTSRPADGARDGLPPVFSHRVAILRWLLWITAIAGLLLSIWNIVHIHWVLAGLEFVMSAYAGVLIWLTRHCLDPGRYSLAYIVPISLIVLYGCLDVAIGEALFVWILVVPSVAYLLLGQRDGALFTLVFMALAALVLGYKFATVPDPVFDATIVNLVLCVVCITGLAHVYEVTRADAESRLRAMAMKDSLTGVFNRTGLNVRFDEYTVNGSATRLALILLDLDHFKSVNDSFGHQAGDAVLKRVAALMYSQTRSSDTLGRLGGEEFVVLLPNHGIDDAYAVAERIRTDIAVKSSDHGSHAIPITATLGLAEFKPGDDLDSLIERADACLYRGKRNNRNQVVA